MGQPNRCYSVRHFAREIVTGGTQRRHLLAAFELVVIHRHFLCLFIWAAPSTSGRIETRFCLSIGRSAEFRSHACFCFLERALAHQLQGSVREDLCRLAVQECSGVVDGRQLKIKCEVSLYVVCENLKCELRIL